MATKLNNNRSASKMYQMASNTFETITIMIATISLAIIATAISSGSLNGMNVAAAAAAVTTISLTDQQPKVAALIPTLHVSSASALASATMPDYGITNVTAQVGTNAYLPCKVSISIRWILFYFIFYFFFLSYAIPIILSLWKMLCNPCGAKAPTVAFLKLVFWRKWFVDCGIWHRKLLLNLNGISIFGTVVNIYDVWTLVYSYYTSVQPANNSLCT